MIAYIISAVIVLLALSGFLWFWYRHNKKLPDKQKVHQLAGALHIKDVQAAILIESIADGILVTDTAGKITLINKAAAEMCEWSKDEAQGFDVKVVLRLLADEKNNLSFSDAEHPFTKVLQKGEPFSATMQLVSRQNKRLFISLVISPIILPKDKQLVGAVAVFRDVTKEKNDEQRRAEFISTASHEMRTPVAAIEGYLALALNDKVSKIDVKAREYLEKAHSSTQHLGKLFQDLLTSAKAEDGRLASHPVVVEVGSFLEQLIEDLRFSAQKKGLAVEYVTNNASADNGVIDASKGSVNNVIQPLYFVHADPDRIQEVITNVFDNAVKYTDEGKISVGLTGNQEVVQISIKDTGPGIPRDDLPHLFQKFYRVDNSATRTIGGTGLGLFICRKIVELYSGVIWAESEVGKGSTFYINLPRLSSQEADQLKLGEKSTSLA